jgi:hypothetical protein
MMTPAELGTVCDGALDLAQAMAVRGDHARLAAIGLEVNAVEVKARLVVADGEQRALDHFLEHGALERGVRRFAMVWNFREVTVGHADDAIDDLAALDLGPVVV